MSIKRSLCEIQDNLKWFKPNDKHCSLKPTKLYKRSILKLWTKSKRILDAKRKLDNVSWSKMYLKVKSEIKDLRKGSIGVLQCRNSNAALSKVFDLALNLAVHFGQANLVEFSLCINELFKLVPVS